MTPMTPAQFVEKWGKAMSGEYVRFVNMDQRMPVNDAMHADLLLYRASVLEEAARVAGERTKLYDGCRELVEDSESIALYEEKAAIAYCIARDIRALRER